MKRSLLARLGFSALVVVLAAVSVTTPASAAAETGSVQGLLLDNDGTLIEGVQVTLYTADDDHLAYTTTDADGKFAFDDVEAGQVKVHFEVIGVDQWATGKRTSEEATLFAVRAGETLTVTERLLPTGTITGRLTTSSGTPVTSGEVSAWSDSNDDGTLPWGHFDEDGRYTIRVAPGEYAVEFELFSVEQWAYQAREREDATRFTVAAGQTVVVDDSLLPAGSVSGRVVDAAGNPLAGTTVALHAEDSSAAGTTDEDGRYRIEPVFAGDYQVSFTLPSGATQWAHGKPTRASADVITVRSDENTTVDEMFGPTGAVAGRFTDDNGRGLPGYSVEVSAYDENEDDDGEGTTYQTETDDEGRYRVDDVLPGRYVVSFVDQETWRRQYAYGKGDRADADPIVVVAGETTTVDDKRVPGASLRITATDARTGAPVDSFCAWVFGPSEGGDCTTSAEVVVDNLAAGPYTVDVSSPRGGLYLDANAHVTATAGQSRPVAVPMRLGGAISATVTDRATGQPAEACLATIAKAGGFSSESGNCSDEPGRVQTRAMEPGTYTVFVNPSGDTHGAQWLGKTGGTGSQAAALRIKVKAGKVATAPEIKLDPAGAVAGTVTKAADGKPVGAGSVSYDAWDFGAGPSGDAEIDQNGRYRLTGLGPYEWPLLFTAGGAPRQWSGGTGNRLKAETVRVVAGDTVTYDAALRAGTVLRGTVTHAKGAIRWGLITAYNAQTGDPIGARYFEDGGSYEMSIIGSQAVKIRYDVKVDGFPMVTGWYGGADLAHAKRVYVSPSRPTSLSITVG